MRHWTRKSSEGVELWIAVEPTDMPMPMGMKGLSMRCFQEDGRLIQGDEWELRWAAPMFEMDLPSLFYDQAHSLAASYIGRLNQYLRAQRRGR